MKRRYGRVIALSATLAATAAAMLGAPASASATEVCQLGHCVDVTAGPTGAIVTIDGVTNSAGVCSAPCGGRPSGYVSLANGTATVAFVGGPTMTHAQLAAAGHTITLYKAFGGWVGGSVDGQSIGPVRVCPPVCN